MIAYNPAPTKHEKAGGFEYRMSEAMARVLLSVRKGKYESGLDVQQYLCHIVNEQFGLLHKVKRVIID